MKNITRLAIITTAIALPVLLTPSALAADITGSIGFGSLFASITGGSFATATSFTLTDPFVTTETGVYMSVPLTTPVTFDGFQFNPPAASVTPLWTLTVGTSPGITYSFDASSIVSSYDSVRNEWDIGGDGTAMVTGYTPTPGVWNVNLSESGASIVFDSSAAVTPVPEPSILYSWEAVWPVWGVPPES